MSVTRPTLIFLPCGAVDAELLRDRGVLRERLGDPAGARADFEAGLSSLREGDPPELAEDLRRRLA